MCHLSEIPKQIDGLNESRWSTPPMFPVHRSQMMICLHSDEQSANKSALFFHQSDTSSYVCNTVEILYGIETSKLVLLQQKKLIICWRKCKQIIILLLCSGNMHPKDNHRPPRGIQFSRGLLTNYLFIQNSRTVNTVVEKQ